MGGCPLHTLIGLGQNPALTGKVGTWGQVRHVPLTADLWEGIAKNLQLAAEACDEAIAGIDKLITRVPAR
jgi:hypothetical protein